MRKRIKKTSVTAFIIILSMCSVIYAQMKDYQNDALKITDKVEDFVINHNIFGTDLEIVHKIIELMHNELYSVRIDRKRMESWVTSPGEAQEFKSQLEWLDGALDQLNRIRMIWPLSQTQTLKREGLEKAIFYGKHDLQAYENVFKKKDIYARDIPFAVSGAEAVEFGISDGCTTATKKFIVLAKAAGIKNIRFVCTGCTSNYNGACPVKGQSRQPNVTINGHFFALVKIEDRWALVNCTYFNPHAIDEQNRYETFFSLDGLDFSPENLKLRILKIPSFQKEEICQSQLYVIAVGKHCDDDLDVENYEALMNLSVSGDRNCSTCRYNNF